MVTEEREETVNRKEGEKNQGNKGSHSHEEPGLSRIRGWAAVQLGQALGIACSGEQPGAPAPLACAERRISHRHLQGTAAQATEPDPSGAEGGNELHLSSSAGLVYPDPEGFPSQPEHCP